MSGETYTLHGRCGNCGGLNIHRFPKGVRAQDRAICDHCGVRAVYWNRTQA